MIEAAYRVAQARGGVIRFQVGIIPEDFGLAFPLAPAAARTSSCLDAGNLPWAVVVGD